MSVNSSVDAISADLSENVLVQNATLHRKIGWQGAFWVASGVPALVLFSIGAIAATVGKPAWMIWAISITFGFIQAFTYAEIAQRMNLSPKTIDGYRLSVFGKLGVKSRVGLAIYALRNGMVR